MVEQYLKRFVGESFVISETADIVYIGADLPDEYAHSEYTHILRGANAKAKANAIQGVPEIVEIASEKRYTENYKMLSMVGIDMNLDLHCQYLTEKERLITSMFFV